MAMISTRGRYALRILLDLAEHQGESDYLPLKEVAERQEISEKYLARIVKSLVQAKILKGSRGKGGGYRLMKAPEDCSLGSVLRVTEGDLSPVSCIVEGVAQCEQAAECPTLPTWIRLNSLIQGFLDGVTLADLMGKDREIE
jgi:Rrf2 family protein